MAIPIASIGSLPATLEPSAQGATGAATDTATPGGDLFGALLAAESAPATTETALLDLTTDLTTDQTTDTSALAGLLAFASQILNIPANAAVAQANGETATAAPLVQLPSDSRARADQIALGTANVISLPAAPQPAPVVIPEAQPVEVPAVPLPDATSDEPSAAELADRAARSPNTGTPNIVAQPPLLTVGAPVPPPAPALNEITPPVVEPVATVPTSALPEATIGARPSTAGEQFAALASSGERLAAPVPTPDTSVAQVAAPATFATAARETASPNEIANDADIVELPPAIPDAPVRSETPTARIGFPAARGGIPVAEPAIQFESALAQSALVIASASDRLGARPELVEPDAPADGTAASAAAVAFVPPAPARVPAASTAPAAPTAVAPLPVAEQVAGALVSRAEVAKHNGSTEFQMRLDPPELGRLHVKLVASGDELRGQVLVADDTVKRLLESQLPELRHKLEAAGVSVQSLDVATDPNGGRGAFRDERDERPAFAAPLPREPEPVRRPRPAPVAARVGALDVTV